MCMLTYLPPGIAPDTSALLTGGLCNPDGHGWAIAVPGHSKILTGKSLDLHEAITQFTRARSQAPGTHALFHSRLATHGPTTMHNCHPFPISRDPRVVLAHNGVLPTEMWPATGDNRSDTRILADDHFRRRWPSLDRHPAQSHLASWAGASNRLVILSVHPGHRQRAYLINAGAGEWDPETGIWYSNSDYRNRWADECGAERVCPCCGHTGPGHNGYCTACGMCWDCGGTASRCICFRLPIH